MMLAVLGISVFINVLFAMHTRKSKLLREIKRLRESRESYKELYYNSVLEKRQMVEELKNENDSDIELDINLVD